MTSAPPWLVVTGDLTPYGGMDVANWGLARHLAGRHPLHLVTHRAIGDWTTQPGVQIHRVWRPLGRHMLGAPLLDRTGRRWAKIISQEGGRVVVNGGNCHGTDINWVHYVHAAYEPAFTGPPWRRLKARLAHRQALAREQRCLQASRVVVCNSQLTARHVIERVGVHPDRVRVVYYGIDAERFPKITPEERQAARQHLQLDDRPWVVFVGALGDARKGFDTLYAAWKDLCSYPEWDANLAVVGRGASLPAWQARAHSEGLKERIHFLGFRDDVPRVLAAMDAMVHPARYEAYGLGVQEALARGLPVLVSAQAGVAERYGPDLHDLLLPDPEDVPALAERLRAWRKQRQAWAERMQSASQSFRQRSWDEMAREFVTATTS